jgi:multidrug efflux system membrane fusion protein
MRATFANEDQALWPAAFVNIRILVDTLHGALLVPTPAILTGAPGSFVYFVNRNNTVSVRKVITGPSDGVNTVIMSGLQPGDMVVTDGTDRLTDKAKVRISNGHGGGTGGSQGGGGHGGHGHQSQGEPAAG